VEDAAWKLAVLRDLGRDPETRLVHEALARELPVGRERVLLLLSFLFDPAAIRRAADNLRHESRDRRAYALEMLDVTLPADWRGRLMPLFEDLSPEERLLQLTEGTAPEAASCRARLEEMMGQPAGRLASWTAASVAQAAMRVGARRPADMAVDAEVKDTMLTIEKVIILKSVHMFAEASDEILSDVAAIVEELDVPAGRVIFEKGEAGDSMYVIVEGAVHVYDGERTICRLGARDIFGELALLDPEPRLASVSAEAPTRLLRLDREAFLELMEANIEIVRGVLHVLCERLRRASGSHGGYEDRSRAAS
jgi:cyclic nucleotide-binding protein